MKCRIEVDKTQLSRFRRRAIAAYREGKEYIELIAGDLHSNRVVITEFIQIEHTADAESLNYEDDVLEEHKRAIHASGLVWLGSIHSHPDCPPYPSETDNVGAIFSGDVLIGILHIRTAKDSSRVVTDTRWWWTQCSASDVRYVNTSGD